MSRRYVVRGSVVYDTHTGRTASFGAHEEASLGAHMMNTEKGSAEFYCWSESRAREVAA